MSPDACERCGRDPATGLAFRMGGRYCHSGESPTCYEQQAWEEHQEALRKLLRQNE